MEQINLTHGEYPQKEDDLGEYRFIAGLLDWVTQDTQRALRLKENFVSHFDPVVNDPQRSDTTHDVLNGHDPLKGGLVHFHAIMLLSFAVFYLDQSQTGTEIEQWHYRSYQHCERGTAYSNFITMGVATGEALIETYREMSNELMSPEQEEKIREYIPAAAEVFYDLQAKKF